MQREAPELLDLQILKGEKDGLREVNSIMLSESTADALFGNQEPIGKVVKASNQYDLMVTAVYKDIPVNNTFNDTDYIIPWDQYLASREWVREAEDQWGNNSFQMFVELKDNVAMETVNQTIRNIKKDLNEDTAEFNPQIFSFSYERMVFGKATLKMVCKWEEE